MRIFLLLIISSFSFQACVTELKPAPESYAVVNQSKPTPKIFYPVRSVRPELPTAANAAPQVSKQVIVKSFHFQLEKVRICKVAKVLASTLRFSHYCDPTLFAKRVSINQILTPYEFADWLQDNRGIKVVIDRISRQVRFLQADLVPPRYPKNSDLEYLRGINEY